MSKNIKIAFAVIVVMMIVLVGFVGCTALGFGGWKLYQNKSEKAIDMTKYATREVKPVMIPLVSPQDKFESRAWMAIFALSSLMDSGYSNLHYNPSERALAAQFGTNAFWYKFPENPK